MIKPEETTFHIVSYSELACESVIDELMNSWIHLKQGSGQILKWNKNIWLVDSPRGEGR